MALRRESNLQSKKDTGMRMTPRQTNRVPTHLICIFVNICSAKSGNTPPKIHLILVSAATSDAAYETTTHARLKNSQKSVSKKCTTDGRNYLMDMIQIIVEQGKNNPMVITIELTS